MAHDERAPFPRRHHGARTHEQHAVNRLGPLQTCPGLLERANADDKWALAAPLQGRVSIGPLLLLADNCLGQTQASEIEDGLALGRRGRRIPGPLWRARGWVGRDDRFCREGPERPIRDHEVGARLRLVADAPRLAEQRVQVQLPERRVEGRLQFLDELSITVLEATRRTIDRVRIEKLVNGQLESA